VYSSSKRALAGLSLTAREELKKDNIVVGVVYPYITLTNFGKNTIREPQEESWPTDGNSIPGDTAEYIAQKILDGIENGDAEIFAHDWMKKMAEGGA
jgi:short-subunit dehydrogenase